MKMGLKSLNEVVEMVRTAHADEPTRQPNRPDDYLQSGSDNTLPKLFRKPDFSGYY